MPFQYKNVLMIGATSGIGSAIASRLVTEGSKVIAVGRRQDRLDEFVSKHGKEKVSAVKFDISDRSNMDSFVSNIAKANPDLDCVFLNAGTQNRMDLAEPTKVDLSAIHSEINLNFNAIVDLSFKFLPYLMEKKTETSLIYTTSNLAIIPGSRVPAYSASKAALNAFILCLRDQLRDSTVKIIELSPPAVQTELHDYLGEERGRNLGMPLAAFTDEAYKGLTSGKDQIVIGAMVDVFPEIVEKRRAGFDELATKMRGLM